MAAEKAAAERQRGGSIAAPQQQTRQSQQRVVCGLGQVSMLDQVSKELGSPRTCWKQVEWSGLRLGSRFRTHSKFWQSIERPTQANCSPRNRNTSFYQNQQLLISVRMAPQLNCNWKLVSGDPTRAVRSDATPTAEPDASASQPPAVYSPESTGNDPCELRVLTEDKQKRTLTAVRHNSLTLSSRCCRTMPPTELWVCSCRCLQACCSS